MVESTLPRIGQRGTAQLLSEGLVYDGSRDRRDVVNLGFA